MGLDLGAEMFATGNWNGAEPGIQLETGIRKPASILFQGGFCFRRSVSQVVEVQQDLDALTSVLAIKQTDCLAKDKCGVGTDPSASCCG